MDTVYLIAYVFGRKEKLSALLQSLETLALHTRKEEGNIQFLMHEKRDDPTTFVFYEAYKNEEVFEKHLNSSHVKNFIEESQVQGLFSKDVEIIRLNKLSE